MGIKTPLNKYCTAENDTIINLAKLNCLKLKFVCPWWGCDLYIETRRQGEMSTTGHQVTNNRADWKHLCRRQWGKQPIRQQRKRKTTQQCMHSTEEKSWEHVPANQVGHKYPAPGLLLRQQPEPTGQTANKYPNQMVM